MKFPPLSWNGVAQEVDFDRSFGDVATVTERTPSSRITIDDVSEKVVGVEVDKELGTITGHSKQNAGSPPRIHAALSSVLKGIFCPLWPSHSNSCFCIGKKIFHSFMRTQCPRQPGTRNGRPRNAHDPDVDHDDHTIPP